ncbi:uncharacterized protein LOC103703762 isoform X2 [Phoenix dactylifera]|nr:uncharacterized protein LOC103703762 isoform X2 [Phoenix dactylifera]XP_026659087.1 uncharacterized protein LOC103703762 isoform X2 [Phoenix dactylifera]
MGANCCVAARDKPLPDRSQFEVSTFRNLRRSPSWSFRWDNRTHIEDIMDSLVQISPHNSGNASSEIKSGATTETEGLSDRGSQQSPSKTRKWNKSSTNIGSDGNSKPTADQFVQSNSSPEERNSIEPSGKTSASDGKPSISVPITPSLAFKSDPSSSRSHSLSSDPTSSRKAHCSPGYQLSRQVSDSRIPSLKSMNENSSPEKKQSSVLSVCSNDLSTGGSHGGSSDGWSMRTFSELVASSQRERWSIDSENLSSSNCKIEISNTQQTTPLSPDCHTCRVCSKLLKERSPWSAQKIVSTNELSIVAVLVCGHVYHVDCLENMTPEAERYDPPCPVCTHGEKFIAKLLGKAELKGRNKISRTAVADVAVDSNSLSEHQKRSGKRPRAGSSMKSSFGRPFLRWRFSIGSRPTRSISDNESTRKKGFWARYLRD